MCVVCVDVCVCVCVCVCVHIQVHKKNEYGEKEKKIIVTYQKLKLSYILDPLHVK